MGTGKSMYKSFFAGVCLFALMGCGAGVDQDPGDPGGGVDPVNDLQTFVGESGDMNKLEYDAVNDELIINNLPFDGVDGRYVNSGQGTVNGAGPITGFGVYESIQGGESGVFQYYAVFTQSGNAMVGAAGTGSYREFGHGGAVIGRDAVPTTLPVGKGELVYNGLYAGIQILDVSNAAAPSSDDVRLVRGTASLAVDLRDFDVTGSIVGFINNRRYYKVDGTAIPYTFTGPDNDIPVYTLPVVSINEGSTISADGKITGGTVHTEGGGGTVKTGTFEGMFAGPNGEEIAGAIIMSGPERAGSAINSQETGVFIVAD